MHNETMIAPIDMETIREAIRKGLADKKMSPTAAAVAAGQNRNAVRFILSGQIPNPGYETLRAIFSTLEISGEALALTKSSDSDAPTLLAVDQIPILGKVEAGAFREHDMFQDVDIGGLPTLDRPKDKRFPSRAQFALEVQGDSMNAATPAPILPGTFVCCVDYAQSPIELESKMIAVVRREQAGLYEYTCKRVYLFKDRIELRPESTNPAHEPIVLPRNFSEEHTEVAVVGIVYALHTPVLTI